MVNNEVVGFLSAQLSDKHQTEDLRVAAADGLGYSGFSNGRNALLKIAQDENESTVLRQAAMRALGKSLHCK
ncbi:HEAT repeat domain-containing protein [Pseudomonas sp. CF10PS3]